MSDINSKSNGLFLNNIDLAYNEVVTNASVNRNFEKLLSNDVMLLLSADSAFDNINYISEYVEGYPYKAGDAVFYIEHRYDQWKLKNGKEIKQSYKSYEDRLDKDSFIIKEVHTIENIFLLKSLVDDNRTRPSYRVIDGLYYFDDSGWRNQNNFGSIFFTLDELPNTRLSDDGGKFYDRYVVPKVDEMIYENHELCSNYHKHGTLRDYDELTSKVLFKDFSNADPNRNVYFWPAETKTFGSLKLSLTNASNIDNSSTMRVWENGILEYDIIYSFVNETNVVPVLDDSGNKIAAQSKLYPNEIDILRSDYPEDHKDYNENYRYFNTSADYDIFNVSGSKSYAQYKNTMQMNVLPYQNAYSCTLEFPKPFKDLDYMVFSSSTARSNSEVQSVNTITFTNKTRHSISPIYIVSNPEDPDLGKSVLINNTFRCQIIGRWK